MTVTGPPLRICSRNSGTTLPAESSTLPKRTVMKRVADFAAKFWQKISAARLHAPMTLVGLTALSVEIRTKQPTPMAIGSLRGDLGAEHVVAECFAHLALQQRHVLERGGVKHDLRTRLARTRARTRPHRRNRRAPH